MPATRISALGRLNNTTIASSDVLVAVDVSDTSMAASGTDKGILYSDLVTAVLASNANLNSIAGLATTGPTQISTWTAANTATLVDYTTDWLAQYAPVAGRATTQEWRISTNALGTLTGSGAGTANNGLTLKADTSNAAGTHIGQVAINAPLRLMSTSGGDLTETFTADPTSALQVRGTKTFNFANCSWQSLQGIIGNKLVLQFSQNTAAIAAKAFSSAGIYMNTPGVSGVVVGAVPGFDSRGTWRSDGGATTFNPCCDIYSMIRFETVNSGTLTTATDWANYEAGIIVADAGCAVNSGIAGFSVFAPQVTGGTLAGWTAFRILTGTFAATVVYGIQFQTLTAGSTTTGQWGMYIQAMTGGAATTNQYGIQLGVISGASANNIGIDIAAPSGGTANIGIRSAGSILHTGTTGIGQMAGAGGAVTQATNRTTAVTLNKLSGAITLFSAAGSATWATFTVNNTTVAANDTIDIVQKSGANLYSALVTAVAANSFNVSISAVSGTATEAPVFQFNVWKGAIT